MRVGQQKYKAYPSHLKTRWCFIGALALMAAAICVTGRAFEADSAQNRISDSVRVLADDAMEGRGIGTAGIDRAAEYIAE